MEDRLEKNHLQVQLKRRKIWKTMKIHMIFPKTRKNEREIIGKYIIEENLLE